ncbi:MAG: VanZ family protein [Thermodesulfobacteriota bacterium]
MIVRLLPALIVMATIFFLSHLPGDSLDFNHPKGTDKVYHAIAFGLLALSGIYVVKSDIDNRKIPLLRGLAIIIFCLIYGVSDEFHQSFIRERFFDWRDLAADTLGALLIILCWWIFHYYRMKNLKKLYT